MLASQGIDGLIGRDLLSQCFFLYDGPANQFLAIMTTAATSIESSWPAGWFPKGGYPCHVAMNLPIASGNRFNIFFRISSTTAKRGTRGSRIDNSSMVSCGAYTPVHSGAMSHHAMGRGRQSTTASAGGGLTAPGCGSLPTCSTTWISTDASVNVPVQSDTSGSSSARTVPCRRWRGWPCSLRSTDCGPAPWPPCRRRERGLRRRG